MANKYTQSMAIFVFLQEKSTLEWVEVLSVR